MEALNSFFTPEVLWFAAGISLLIMEFAGPGVFLGFFGIGAVVVGIICLFFDPSFTLQMFLFLATSLILLFSLRKWLKSVFFGASTVRGTELDDTTDNFLGARAVVSDKITKTVSGRIALYGTEWTAESDEDIAKGASVEVIGKKNLVLKVKPIT